MQCTSISLQLKQKKTSWEHQNLLAVFESFFESHFRYLLQYLGFQPFKGWRKRRLSSLLLFQPLVSQIRHPAPSLEAQLDRRTHVIILMTSSSRVSLCSWPSFTSLIGRRVTPPGAIRWGARLNFHNVSANPFHLPRIWRWHSSGRGTKGQQWGGKGQMWAIVVQRG